MRRLTLRQRLRRIDWHTLTLALVCFGGWVWLFAQAINILSE